MPEPTDSAPGSAEKERVLEQRAALGEELFSPADWHGTPAVEHERPLVVKVPVELLGWLKTIEGITD